MLPLARVLSNLGVVSALVVHGDDGLDEISLTATTTVCEVSGGALRQYALDPRSLGFALCKPEELAGGDARENVEIALDVLNGGKSPRRDIVLLNSAACLALAGRTRSMAEGVALSEELLDRGAALQKMRDFVEATRRAAAEGRNEAEG